MAAFVFHISERMAIVSGREAEAEGVGMVDDIWYNNYFGFILYNTKMASVQVANGLTKLTTELEAEFSPNYSKFQATYNSIKSQAIPMMFSDVVSETIDMLKHQKVITPDNSVSLERFLQTFYIVNDDDAAAFKLDKLTLQTCFNRLSTTNFIQPKKYIQLIDVTPADNLKGFIDLYNTCIFGKLGGKRRKSISRSRGPSKRRNRSSAKRTTRHTRTHTRRTRHRRR